MRTIAGLALAAALASTACSATYAFVPATSPTSSIYGHAAADYAIPPQGPHGDLRVASYGVEHLSPGESPGEDVASLHVRLFVSNGSDQPWTIDTREQQVDLQGRATSTPAFASASPAPASGPPVVTIAARATRLVDVFFPLPPDVQAASSLPSFQFTARVHTDAGLVTETTPFERIETDDDSAYAYDYSAPQPDYNPEAYGYDYWDSPFWYNPGYVGFYGAVYPRGYWGRPFYARGRGWGRPGYYHGFHGTFHGGGGFHGGGHGGHR